VDARGFIPTSAAFKAAGEERVGFPVVGADVSIASSTLLHAVCVTRGNMDNDVKPIWYWCQLEDASEAAGIPEPDWSRIPEAKREMVREKWLLANAPKPLTERVQLWGPQIPFFAAQPYYKVTILEEA
jgi:hypothetical protein